MSDYKPEAGRLPFEMVRPAASDVQAVEDVSDGPIRHQTTLFADLEEHHVNMMGFSTALGIGLFLSAGKVVFLCGPFMAVIVYGLVIMMMSAIIGCMGEMTALYPVKGPNFEFIGRFIDKSVGLAAAWMSWFAWVCCLTAEIVAITDLFQFRVDQGWLARLPAPPYPNGQNLQWSSTTGYPAVWIVGALLLMLAVNRLPVKWYGRMEYVVGCVKISFLVALIMFNLVVNARQVDHQRFWTYKDPYSWIRSNMTARFDTKPPIVFNGAKASFAAFCTSLSVSFFSIMSWDIILLTAPENKDLATQETTKLACRKLGLRVLLLYTLAVFTVGLNVPFDDTPLRQSSSLTGVSPGQDSIFVLAAIRAKVAVLPHFLNAFFITSAFFTGCNGLYASGRLLHAIANREDAWPRWAVIETIRIRLTRTNSSGVPWYATLTSALFGCMAFVAAASPSDPDNESSSAQTLGRIITAASVSILIVYGANAWAYFGFWKEIRAAANGDRDDVYNLNARLRFRFNRDGALYPYRSRGQYLRAIFALVMCSLLVAASGWQSFLHPFQLDDFLAAYMPVFVFGSISAAYFFSSRSFNPARWHRQTQKLARLHDVGPQAAEPLTDCTVCGMRHRRGDLKLPPENGLTSRKVKAILEFIWTWLR